MGMKEIVAQLLNLLNFQLLAFRHLPSVFMRVRSNAIFITLYGPDICLHPSGGLRKASFEARHKCVTWISKTYSVAASDSPHFSLPVRLFQSGSVIRNRVCSPLSHPALVVQILMPQGLSNAPHNFLRTRSPCPALYCLRKHFVFKTKTFCL